MRFIPKNVPAGALDIESMPVLIKNLFHGPRVK